GSGCPFNVELTGYSMEPQLVVPETAAWSEPQCSGNHPPKPTAEDQCDDRPDSPLHCGIQRSCSFRPPLGNVYASHDRTSADPLRVGLFLKTRHLSSRDVDARAGSG